MHCRSQTGWHTLCSQSCQGGHCVESIPDPAQHVTRLSCGKHSRHCATHSGWSGICTTAPGWTAPYMVPILVTSDSALQTPNTCDMSLGPCHGAGLVCTVPHVGLLRPRGSTGPDGRAPITGCMFDTPDMKHSAHRTHNVELKCWGSGGVLQCRRKGSR